MSDEHPVPNAAPRSSAAKTILIWAVLIAMFVGIYSVFRAEKSASSASPLYLFWFLVAIPVVSIVVLVAVNIRKGYRFVREQHVGLAALHQGELEKARKLFWEWSESSMARVAAISRHNLAWTLMRQGELRHGIEIARHAISRYPLELKAMTTLPTTIVDLALMEALAGDLEAAKTTMADLQQREQRKDHAANAANPAMKVFTNAVIACRDGRADEAARTLDEKWASCESVLTGDVLRPLRVVRAFAIASSDPREAGKADLQLVNARPAFRGEYDFLGKHWPEMQTFLVAHELATPS